MNWTAIKSRQIGGETGMARIITHTVSCLLLVWITTLDFLPHVHADTGQPSEAEIACAETIGLKLRMPVYPVESIYARHLAWLAEEILYGTVSDIQHDLRDVYHTIVAIEVTASLKGEVASGTIFVDLRSGPIYSPKTGNTGEIGAGEPKFTLGENVLVFLTTAFTVSPQNPDKYLLLPGHYRPMGSGKWVVHDDSVAHWRHPEDPAPISWIEEEVRIAVQTQATQCQQGER